MPTNRASKCPARALVDAVDLLGRARSFLAATRLVLQAAGSDDYATAAGCTLLESELAVDRAVALIDGVRACPPR